MAADFAAELAASCYLIAGVFAYLAIAAFFADRRR